MAVQWIKTSFLGVRYRQHKTRKHGVNFDRCYSIRYKLDGKDKEEVVGWSSEGITAEKAYKLLSEIRENIRKGLPENSLASIRAAREKIQEEEAYNKEQETKFSTTIDDFWNNVYIHKSKISKGAATLRGEILTYGKWIKNSIGMMKIRDIRQYHVENIILEASNQGKSPQTIRHIIAIISQIWNMALANEFVDGNNPCSKIKKPQKDARRMRFLSPNEACLLLKRLKERSRDAYGEAVLSLFSGLRAGEIHNLKWSDIDFERKIIFIRDPKNKKSRYAYFTPEIEDVLIDRSREQGEQDLVFPSRIGGTRVAVSAVFKRVVEEVGLNSGITDSRQKVVFHTLRHTFASWLVQKRTPLYTVAELMGHTSLAMTTRYAHLAPDNMRQAVDSISGMLNITESKIG